MNTEYIFNIREEKKLNGTCEVLLDYQMTSQKFKDFLKINQIKKGCIDTVTDNYKVRSLYRNNMGDIENEDVDDFGEYLIYFHNDTITIFKNNWWIFKLTVVDYLT